MKKFKLRLRFSRTPGNYRDVMNVFYLHDLSKSIDTCTVYRENGEIIGYLDLSIDVSDDLYVYYRYNSPDGEFNAIQFLAAASRYGSANNTTIPTLNFSAAAGVPATRSDALAVSSDRHAKSRRN
jgi:hypothetical protein